jgi:large subunit ribosomal protein L30
MNASKRIKVTQIGSLNKRLKAHKACVRGLGLRRIGHTVTVIDSPENRGMIRAVSYLLKIEETA